MCILPSELYVDESLLPERTVLIDLSNQNYDSSLYSASVCSGNCDNMRMFSSPYLRTWNFLCCPAEEANWQGWGRQEEAAGPITRARAIASKKINSAEEGGREWEWRGWLKQQVDLWKNLRTWPDITHRQIWWHIRVSEHLRYERRSERRRSGVPL